MKMCRKAKSARRRGTVLVLTAVSLVTLLLFASLAVDVGYICALTAEQQNNADSSALAGASGLQDENAWVAHERALEMLALNQPPQGYRSLEDQIIEFGWFDSAENKFNRLDDPSGAFAVRVQAARNGVPLFFAGIMGIHTTDVWRDAVAVGSRACAGIWGLEHVDAGSIWTDSYISTDGPYVAADARANGDICCGRDIKVHGSIEAHGDIMPGFGYPLTIAGASGVITGITTSHEGGLPAVPADLGDAAFNNDNATIPLTDAGNDPFGGGWNMALKGGENLTLAGGNYYLESLKITGGATMTVTGPTTLYLAGPLDATGGSIINNTTNPHNLTIISIGDKVRIGGATAFYGSIMAPYAEMSLSSGAGFYGALLGRIVNMKGNFTIHVDESLPLAQPLFDPPPPMLVK